MAAPEAVPRDAGPEIDLQEMPDEVPPMVEMPDEVTPMVEVAAADPSLGGLAVGLLVGLLTLLLIWWLVSRRRLGRAVLICGSSDSGKTRLLGQLVAGKLVETYSSMQENLHPWAAAAGGPALQLVDVPGSERIRGAALERHGPSARGILFVVDSATLTKQVRDVAEYLHSILTLPTVAANSPPLLVFCNKQDLALAKASVLIKAALEKELDKVRVSRGAQLAGLEGASAGTVFLGKQGRTFEFGQLAGKVAFCEGSGLQTDTLQPVLRWLEEIA